MQEAGRKRYRGLTGFAVIQRSERSYRSALSDCSLVSIGLRLELAVRANGEGSARPPEGRDEYRSARRRRAGLHCLSRLSTHVREDLGFPQSPWLRVRGARTIVGTIALTLVGLALPGSDRSDAESRGRHARGGVLLRALRCRLRSGGVARVVIRSSSR